MASVIEISDLITEYGAYYTKGSENESRLYQLLYHDAETDKLLTPILSDDTFWKTAKASIDRVLQPFQKAWTPISTATFTPLAVEQFRMKIDFELHPDEIYASWLGFLRSNSFDRKEWPIVRYLTEELLLKQGKEDWETNEVFYGVQADPTPGTAGAASTSINGIRFLRNYHINTTGRIEPFVGGAVPTDASDFLAYVEAFADDIDIRYAMKKMVIAMSPTKAKLYGRGYREVRGKDTDFEKNQMSTVDQTNLSVIGLPSMVGTDIMFCAPKGNLIKLMPETVNVNEMKVENIDRQVKMYTDWSAGVGIIMPEAFFTNDADTMGVVGGS